MLAILQEQADREQVVLWEPQLPGDSCVRTLFIDREINDGFDPATWTDPEFAHRYALLAGDFDRFATGETIPVGWDPYDKDDSAFMARVDPADYGIWTIRSVAPSPAIRIFGAFFQADTFIALRAYERKELGGRGDRRWAAARENAIARWDNLFGSIPRLNGGKINDFISQKTVIV